MANRLLKGQAPFPTMKQPYRLNKQPVYLRAILSRQNNQTKLLVEIIRSTSGQKPIFP